MQVDGLDALLEPEEMQAGHRRGKHRRSKPRTAASVAGAGVALLAVAIALLGWRGISQTDGQAAGATRQPAAIAPAHTRPTTHPTSRPVTPSTAATSAAPRRITTLAVGAVSPPPRSAIVRPSTKAHRTVPVQPPSATPPATTTGSSDSDVAQAVFNALNAARAEAHLSPLAWNAGLQRSAQLHNQAMAAAGQLSHRLPGEPDLGDRESAQGVDWRWAGENIGVNYQLGIPGALSLHAMMLAERPPSDGHRRNILAPRANAVGVDVLVDAAHHALWLTEDFAQV